MEKVTKKILKENLGPKGNSSFFGLKTILKGVCIIVFLYILIFSIQNFWQGFHDVDLSFNFLNLGYSADIGTDGQIHTLQSTYLRGLNQMKNSFIWLCLNCIFGVFIGYLFRGAKNE